jgi:hypothetical protein
VMPITGHLQLTPWYEARAVRTRRISIARVHAILCSRPLQLVCLANLKLPWWAHFCTHCSRLCSGWAARHRRSCAAIAIQVLACCMLLAWSIYRLAPRRRGSLLSCRCAGGWLCRCLPCICCRLHNCAPAGAKPTAILPVVGNGVA